jgi:hypothetical protein
MSTHRTALLALVFGTVVVSGCQESKKEVPSPDGRYIATMSAYGFGAVGHAYTFVNLRRAGSIQSRFTGRVFEVDRAYEITLMWKGRTLEIWCEYCGPTEVNVRERKWRDVTIEYPAFGAKFTPW